MSLKSIIVGILNSRIANADTTLGDGVMRSGVWAPVIRGDGTAGTYEQASAFARYSRIGRRVWLDFFVQLAGAVTGGGTGAINVTGLPFAKSNGSFPVGAIMIYGIAYTAGAHLSINFGTTSITSALYLYQSTNGAIWASIPVSAVVANSRWAASITYETDDP